MEKWIGILVILLGVCGGVVLFLLLQQEGETFSRAHQQGKFKRPELQKGLPNHPLFQERSADYGRTIPDSMIRVLTDSIDQTLRIRRHYPDSAHFTLYRDAFEGVWYGFYTGREYSGKGALYAD